MPVTHLYRIDVGFTPWKINTCYFIFNPTIYIGLDGVLLHLFLGKLSQGLLFQDKGWWACWQMHLYLEAMTEGGYSLFQTRYSWLLYYKFTSITIDNSEIGKWKCMITENQWVEDWCAESTISTSSFILLFSLSLSF